MLLRQLSCLRLMSHLSIGKEGLKALLEGVGREGGREDEGASARRDRSGKRKDADVVFGREGGRDGLLGRLTKLGLNYCSIDMEALLLLAQDYRPPSLPPPAGPGQELGDRSVFVFFLCVFLVVVVGVVLLLFLLLFLAGHGHHDKCYYCYYW